MKPDEVGTTTSPSQSNKGEEESVKSFPRGRNYNITQDDSTGVTTVINTNIHPSDIAHYINSEFHNKETTGGNTKHPAMWIKDKHGRFTYTGSFASDC